MSEFIKDDITPESAWRITESYLDLQIFYLKKSLLTWQCDSEFIDEIVIHFKKDVEDILDNFLITLTYIKDISFEEYKKIKSLTETKKHKIIKDVEKYVLTLSP